MTPQQVVDEARNWLDVRWRHQGRTRNGLDCLGFGNVVAHALGVCEIDSSAYGRTPGNDDRLRQALRAHCVERFGPPEVGMLALMRFGSAPPRHVGFIADYMHGGLSLLHAYAAARKVTEHRLDAVWQARIVGLFDLPGVERV